MARSRPATDHALQQDIVPRPHWQSAADLSGSRAKLVPMLPIQDAGLVH